jgi:hypothetical protein
MGAGAEDMLALEQVGALAPHAVPEATDRQPPLPLQVPSWPHSPPLTLQSLPEAVPAFTGLHWPSP